MCERGGGRGHARAGGTFCIRECFNRDGECNKKGQSRNQAHTDTPRYHFPSWTRISPVSSVFCVRFSTRSATVPWEIELDPRNAGTAANGHSLSQYTRSRDPSCSPPLGLGEMFRKLLGGKFFFRCKMRGGVILNAKKGFRMVHYQLFLKSSPSLQAFSIGGCLSCAVGNEHKELTERVEEATSKMVTWERKWRQKQFELSRTARSSFPLSDIGLVIVVS